VAEDGSPREGKPLMNPNVAIELGYALAKLSDARLLMILNTAYGNRDGLPFDIKHKAGPITYQLAEGASKPEIAAEKVKLIAKLVEALGAIRPAEVTVTSPAFKEVEPKIGKAFYFGDDEVLGQSKHHSKLEHVMPFRSVLYLRIIPTQPLVRPLPVDLLTKNAVDYGAFSTHPSALLVRENGYGVAVINPAGKKLLISIA